MSRPKKPKIRVIIDYVVKEESLPGIIQHMIDTKGEGTVTTRPNVVPVGPIPRSQ